MSERLTFYQDCQEEIVSIVKKCEQNGVEFVRFTYCDTNGIGRCKLVSHLHVFLILDLFATI